MSVISPQLQIPLSQPPALATFFQGINTSVHTSHGGAVTRNTFWTLNLTSDGEGVIVIHGQEIPFYHGCAVLAPPDVDHHYLIQGSVRKTWAHFRTAPGAATAPIPIVQDLGERFDAVHETLLKGRGLVAAEPERALALVWNLLWDLTTGPSGGPTPMHHPIIRSLLAYLADHLAVPLSPKLLARRFHCSPTHLSRLCHQAFQMPLVAYVRHCRVSRAHHLLVNTTRPIADIATEIGYPDPQHFNKLMRLATGRSPRALRLGLPEGTNSRELTS